MLKLTLFILVLVYIYTQL